MKIVLVSNKGSGSSEGKGFSTKELLLEFSKYSIVPDIYHIDELTHDEILGQIDSSNYDVVAAAGGDGTVNFAAGLIAGKDISLGVIPSGTLNHFAKDLNIPLTPETSVELIAKGRASYVDTASVNGRLFLNNSSIGLYPHTVRKRDAQQAKLGRGKWLSMLYGIYSVLKSFPLYAVRINTENDTMLFRSPIVFIGNNEYSIDLFSMGTRKSLTKGKLSLYLAKSNTRFKMLKLLFAAFFNRLKKSDDLEMRLADEITIESRKRNLSVSLDGEVEIMEPPICFRISSKNLKVILPDVTE